jgi:hypothetical protein
LEGEEVPHPRTQFFMGWEHTRDEMNRRDEEAEKDGVYLVWPVHIWPLMGYTEADARWKQGQTDQVHLYALCGVELRSYLQRLDGPQPVPYSEHWGTGSSMSEGREMCVACEVRWYDMAMAD